MSERFKELVLKTSDTATYRGFESHSLRQIKTTHLLVGRFYLSKGIRTSRPNKQSGGLFVGEGFSAEKRIPLFLFCCNERKGRNRIRTLASERIPTKPAQVYCSIDKTDFSCYNILEFLERCPSGLRS